MLITMVSICNFVNIIPRQYLMSKEPILLKFGKNVQEKRKSLKLSQEQLAELAGVHRTYIGMIERAEKTLHFVTLKK